jgi:hypothetical protein
VRLSTSSTLEEVVDDEVDLFEGYTSMTLSIRNLGGLVMRFSFGVSKRSTGGVEMAMEMAAILPLPCSSSFHH